jgi:hypothetical protein
MSAREILYDIEDGHTVSSVKRIEEETGLAYVGTQVIEFDVDSSREAHFFRDPDDGSVAGIEVEASTYDPEEVFSWSVVKAELVYTYRVDRS